MILILSQDSFEITTELVQNWIQSLGGDCVRLNGEDITSDTCFALCIGSTEESAEFQIGSRQFNAAEIGAVWFRRWHTLRTFDYLETGESYRLGREIRDHLVAELRSVTKGLQTLLRKVEWLTQPVEMALNKLEVLSCAAEVGLEVPATLVTGSKARLRTFFDRYSGKIIAKPAGQATQFVLANRLYAMYTAELSEEHLARAPDFFFPTLFQERIDKSFEVRTFALAGRFWSSAIFSQRDPRTRIDFRRYNRERPNRTVPYDLPHEISKKVEELMARLKMTTASLDLIRTPDGRHVLLEINPAGQFGMVSSPCNYQLEKRVAEHLMEMDERHGRRNPKLD